ncbi:MAG: nitric oxide synthase oxygenase [Verrucomicrobia bacterium]|nr:nitric oxide synthase oxygenase [Verrucomicrobiota bacterium]
MKNNRDLGAMIGSRRLKQMQRPTAVVRSSPRSIKDGSANTVLLLEEAWKWLEQFYSETVEMSLRSSNAFNSRWAQVRSQIRDGQLDYLTKEELEHGAKVAWRNSTRCVGRLSWQSLMVRDCRHLDTPEEVFAALVDHIQSSTNGGRIIPMISVFAPGSTERPKVRIWNRQLVGYAGYLRPDGSILGDPLNQNLTQRIQALGWKGPEQGRFNLLPIVIEIDGAIRLFDLPAKIVLEVPIRHSRYDWFEELNLQWFALPAVSSLRLEIGGVSFPAAPFSGWYLGSEIGARDLADTNRYNALPVIAERLGLDTGSNRSLWKDRALVELNDAVLWSFAEAGVAMVDHHTATRQFLIHEKRETEAGRCVYADWSWIVPPISGATTPVFHRKFKERTVKPNFFPQSQDWQENGRRRCPFG